MKYEHFLNHEVFKILSELSKELKINAYVVGGYVRDCFLDINNKDIDIVVEGSGIEFSAAFAVKTGEKHHFYENYGTAMVRFNGIEVEFVGARKEMYERGSRNPIVEDGTLHDDLLRRDFTINAMAISLNEDTYGELIDPFDGYTDLKNGIIRTPGHMPNVTFSDDPLRIYRAVRFKTKLSTNDKTFKYDDDTWEAMENNVNRIGILTRERITEEIVKIFSYRNSYIALEDIRDLKIWAETFNTRTDRTMIKIQLVNQIDKLWFNATDETLQYLKWMAVLGPGSFTYADLERNVRNVRLPFSFYDFMKKAYGCKTIITSTPSVEELKTVIAEVGRDIYDIIKYWHAHELTYVNEDNPEERIKEINEKYKRMKFLISMMAGEYIGFKCPVNGNEISDYMGIPLGPKIGEIKELIEKGILNGTIHYSIEGVYWWMFNNRKNWK